MKKIFAILLSALALGGCENDGIPYVSLGLDDLYKVARMQTVDLKPAFTGESYRWTVKTASGADSLLSEEKDYIFLMQYPGTYDVTFQIFDPVNPIVHRMTFYVVEEEVEYSPYISTVYEYCPAPGQFVNAMPEYREGDTAETMRQKAEEAIAGKMQSGVSLGAYGGYITFGFDHTVVNVPGEYDIRIDGNSFNSAAHPGVDGGSSEPGIIMVMFDENQNGKPDDKWYEIDKNPWYTDEAATYGYEITYHRPAPDHVPTPGEGNDSALTDMTYIKWEDNRGQTDYVYKNKFHDQDYYPKWIDADEMTFRGTLLPKNAVDVSGNGSYYLQYMFKYGAYADNYPNEAKDENGNYRITGRIKDMIIRGGENIYPREIEEFLYQMPGIKDVQVAGVPSKKYGEAVGAFIILHEGCTMNEYDVREFCGGKIDRYKIPKYIFFVKQFPMTGSGKIQKFKLKDLSLELCKQQGIEII